MVFKVFSNLRKCIIGGGLIFLLASIIPNIDLIVHEILVTIGVILTVAGLIVLILVIPYIAYFRRMWIKFLHWYVDGCDGDSCLCELLFCIPCCQLIYNKDEYDAISV